MNTQTAQASSTESNSTVNCHPSFEWIRSENIESLNVQVEEYRHKTTGAIHYHINADNSENVFLVGFRTVPMDSTGVAHILEHTSLCGSDKYPVRDPFFMMIRRSLNTFMNAFTSSDWTAYPFASKNKKDFNNLLDVYLDAVFFTRLDELDFLQEGHRVEFSEPENPDSELEYKGVVFNEMKGAMSSPVSVLWQTISKYLYPTSTYHYNSGGEPADIPDLTYTQLKDFHKTHYHPSNAVFMTFGDIPVFEHQSKFEEQALSQFDKLDVTIKVEKEKRYLSPITVDEAYSYDLVGDETISEKTHHVIGWLLGPSSSLEDMMKANLLSQVLLDNSASPLRMALEKTKLGNAPSPLCGLEDSNFEMCFMCGIEGSEIEHAKAFEDLVHAVLQDVAENGVSQEQLESVLHQIELSQREIGGDGYPFGLQLILGGLSAAIHRNDPVALLNIEPVINSLREEIKDPEFIKQLVKDTLINNQHRVRLTLRPDAELSTRKESAEREQLAMIKDAMNDDDKTAIVKKAKELAERQTQEDDPGVLPKVDLDDVPAEVSIPESTAKDIAGSKSCVYAQGTNGIVYHEVVMDLPSLNTEQINLLPYFSSCFSEVGFGKKSYLEAQALQSSVSGGISTHASIRGAVDDVQKTKGFYMFSGKALQRNNIALANLMSETLATVRFDEHERLKDIISQKRASRERSVTGSGHTLAMSAASAGICPVAKISHQFGGLEGIRFIKALDDANNTDNGNNALENIANQFADIHQKILSAPRQYLMIAEAEKLDGLVSGFEESWQAHTATSSDGFSLPSINERVKQMWVTNTQVNFCAKAYPTVTMTHEDAAPLSVLSGFMRNGYLHTAIREQGGAYGGGAGHDTSNAAFRFFSYRDPRLSETLTDFDKAIEWTLNGTHEWRQVEEAILGVIASLDKPGSPAGEASHAFHNELHGRTRERLQTFRQQVLGVKLEDLQRVAEQYLIKDNESTAVITSASTMEQEGDLGLEIVEL